jgi:excisionase family DNA binding protein
MPATATKASRVVGADPLLKVSEVARMLSVGKQKVYELINGGHLPRAKFDGPMRIWQSDLQRYAERNTSRAV